MHAATLVRPDNLQQVRRLLPVSMIPKVVDRRLDRVWADEAFRAEQEQQMRFLLEHTDRAPEIPELARAYARHMMLRSYLRFHPGAITHQRVRGIERLTSERDPSRGLILSFAHHHQYDGMFASLAHQGARLHAVMTPLMMAPDAPVAFRQHKNVVLRGTQLVPSSMGTDALVELLQPGVTLALASDFPGRTPVTFLGRKVLGSFGAPRIASVTNSPVVLVTARRDASGPYLQLEEPLEPGAFGDPGALLDEILRRHGEAILAWPEALESPQARFGALEG